MTKYCVLYLKDGKEHRSPWFLSRERCQRAFEILTIGHGFQAIVYMD